MINFIKGTIVHSANSQIVVENNGIGYLIYVSAVTLSRLPQDGTEVTIFTNMQVREDNISLFGFLSQPELNLFNQLVTVSGVGAKVATNILSYLPPEELITAILSEDVESLTRCAGVGKKTAQRIVLELKDKMNKFYDDITTITALSKGSDETSNLPVTGSSLPKTEALAALLSLGYTRTEAMKALDSIDTSNLKTEEILKNALKKLATY